MVIGLAVLCFGVAAAFGGNVVSHNMVKRAFGTVDKTTTRLAEGTGVVPPLVSLIVILGYLAAVVGIVLLVVGA